MIAIKNKKSFWIGAAAGLMLAGAVLVPSYGIGAIMRLASVKPLSGVAVTDEQQGILAVRAAKPSVVSITGDDAAGQTLNTVSGSGFIVESDGLIVTNNHVVQDSSLSYTVTLLDGHQFPATVLGLDKYNDIALLKIEATGLATAVLGDSGNLETGQTVFAIGNALGRYQNSVSRGVVSGLGRSVSESSAIAQPRLQNLIQTDAAINPGNSGGPLITMAGEVIGMNTLIDAAGSGLGFAVPSSVIRDSINQLKAFGKVSKSYFGVVFATVTASLKTSKNLSVSQGAYIDTVVPGGPAERAGLKVGDVITAINHELLTERRELDSVVSGYPAGTQILVSYNRDGQSQDAALVLAERE